MTDTVDALADRIFLAVKKYVDGKLPPPSSALRLLDQRLGEMAAQLAAVETAIAAHRKHLGNLEEKMKQLRQDA